MAPPTSRAEQYLTQRRKVLHKWGRELKVLEVVKDASSPDKREGGFISGLVEYKLFIHAGIRSQGE